MADPKDTIRDLPVVRLPIDSDPNTSQTIVVDEPLPAEIVSTQTPAHLPAHTSQPIVIDEADIAAEGELVNTMPFDPAPSWPSVNLDVEVNPLTETVGSVPSIHFDDDVDEFQAEKTLQRIPILAPTVNPAGESVGTVIHKPILTNPPPSTDQRGIESTAMPQVGKPPSKCTCGGTLWERLYLRQEVDTGEFRKVLAKRCMECGRLEIDSEQVVLVVGGQTLPPGFGKK